MNCYLLIFDYTLVNFLDQSDPQSGTLAPEAKKVLKEKGMYISTELGKNGENVWKSFTTRYGSGPKLLFPLPTSSRQDVEFLKTLAEQGHFKPLIDRIYPLDQIVEAYRYVESRQKLGNVIIQIAG